MRIIEHNTNTQGGVGWLNSNELRPYPIDDTATCVDDTGKQLPNDIITDLSVTVMSQHDAVGLRVSAVYVSPEIVSVTVASETGGILAGTYPTTSVIPYRPMPLTCVADYRGTYALNDLDPGQDSYRKTYLTGPETGSAGYITFGTHPLVARERYTFSEAEQSLIACRCIRVACPPDVVGIKGYTGGQIIRREDVATLAQGIVKLTASPGVIFETDKETNTITISLTGELMESLTNRCNGGVSAETCGSPPLLSINSVLPDLDGTITLEFK